MTWGGCPCPGILVEALGLTSDPRAVSKGFPFKLPIDKVEQMHMYLNLEFYFQKITQEAMHLCFSLRHGADDVRVALVGDGKGANSKSDKQWMNILSSRLSL